MDPQTIVTVCDGSGATIKIEPGLVEQAMPMPTLHNVTNGKYTITSHIVSAPENTPRVANFKIVNTTHSVSPIPQYQVPKYVVQMRNGTNNDVIKSDGGNPPKFYVVQSGSKDSSKPEMTGIEIINMPEGAIQWNGKNMIVANPINKIISPSTITTAPAQSTSEIEAQTANNSNSAPVSYSFNSTKNRRKTNPMTGVTSCEPEPIIQQSIIFGPNQNTPYNMKSDEMSIDLDSNPNQTKFSQAYSHTSDFSCLSDDSYRRRNFDTAFPPVTKVEPGTMPSSYNYGPPMKKSMKNIEFADKLREIQAKMITGAIQLQELLEKQKEENVVSHALFFLELKGELEPHLELLDTALEAIIKVAPKVDYVEIGPQDNRYFVKKENWHKAATKETLKDAAVSLFECDLFIPKKEKLSSTVGRRSTFVVNGLILQPLNPSKLNAIFNVLASNRLPNVKRLEADVVSNPGFLSQNEQKIVKEALAQYLNQFRQREKKLLQTKKEDFDAQVPDVKINPGVNNIRIVNFDKLQQQ